MITLPILYKCSWKGCSKILDTKGYCSIHKKKADSIKKQRYKDYDTIRRLDEEYIKYRRLYDSAAWSRLRAIVISNCYAIDILEYYKTGNIVQGERVHHIKTLEDDWNSRLDEGNLIYLTEKNHRRVHVEYIKGPREKEQMQQILLGLRYKFIEEFGV